MIVEVFGLLKHEPDQRFTCDFVLVVVEGGGGEGRGEGKGREDERKESQGILASKNTSYSTKLPKFMVFYFVIHSCLLSYESVRA